MQGHNQLADPTVPTHSEQDAKLQPGKRDHYGDYYQSEAGWESTPPKPDDSDLIFKKIFQDII